MSVLRKDPLTHAWVIFAEERYQPPAPESPQPAQETAPNCPFCEGNERMTPPEIMALRAPGSRRDGPGWSVRAIPNQFAVLKIEGKFDRRGEGLYDMMNGIGAHEVVIETPRHDARLSEFPPEKIQEILWVLRERAADLLRDQRFRYIQIFKNQGGGAGATIAHPHSQLVALPILPRWVREELTQSYEYFRLKERCLFCDIIAQDTRTPRLVYENDHFVSLAPFASKFPFETWIYPKEHSSSFHTTPDAHLPALADALKTTLLAFRQAISDPPYNLIIHSAPQNPERSYHDRRARVQDHYHWHIEIIPRATRVAGFEYGTGFYINSVFPESAAEFLRQVIEEGRAEKGGR